MSQDTERLYCCCGAEGSVCADPDGRLPLSHVDYIADCARQPEFRMLAREVQELRHLRDNVIPDLQEELGMANAYIAASRKLVADLRALHQPEWASEDAKAAGKDPWVCELCGVADGHWPCDSARMIDEAGL